MCVRKAAPGVAAGTGPLVAEFATRRLALERGRRAEEECSVEEVEVECAEEVSLRRMADDECDIDNKQV